MEDLEEKLDSLPNQPGVYLMKDSYKNVIYVGKGKNLRKRVRQYFQSSREHPSKIEEMKIVLEDFDYIVTDSEIDALLLENTLIKKYKPRYNSMMKNFQKYTYIKIYNERFPRIAMEKEVAVDGGQYFGPFTKGFYVNETIEFIKDIFPIRRCNKRIDTPDMSPCLNFHIGKCAGPCTGKISEEEYKEILEDIRNLLRGNHHVLINTLEEQMLESASQREFKQATIYRDRLALVRSLVFKQKAVSLAVSEDDIIAFSDREDKIIQIFFIRGGKILGRKNLKSKVELEDKNMLVDFISEFYQEEIMVNNETVQKDAIDEAQIIERWLLRENGIYFKVDKLNNINDTIKMTAEKITDILRGMREKFYK